MTGHQPPPDRTPLIIGLGWLAVVGFAPPAPRRPDATG